MTLAARTLGLLTLLVITSFSATIVQNFGGEIYGTTYSIKIAENKSYSFLNTDIIDELNRIDYVFSTYKPTSEISLINKDPKRAWSNEFRDLFNLSDEISNLSEGAFSPNDANGFDFSAIGKGYAIDKIAELMEKNGVNNYFIEIGGEIRAKGLKFSDEWIFGIERPTNSKKSPYIAFNVPSKGISIATSGEYREPNHIWGKGPRDLISVTVATSDAASADAWATALYVLGKEKGLDIAEKNNLEVFFITNNGDSIQSTNWSMISL
ncbi:MAG: FAD:protein FMN transferase [Rhodobacterales bacterium]|nr:FAD:protein FMN transferase [Rhodobacterales bacterium]